MLVGHLMDKNAVRDLPNPNLHFLRTPPLPYFSSHVCYPLQFNRSTTPSYSYLLLLPMAGSYGFIGAISTASITLSPNPNLLKPGQTSVKSSACARSQSQTQKMGIRCDAENLYDVLGISSGATDQEIKASYRRLARLFHPDTAKFSSATEKDKSTQHFIKIRNAYTTLSDPQSRAGYDRRRFTSTFGRYSSKASYSRQFVGRNWETEQCW